MTRTLEIILIYDRNWLAYTFIIIIDDIIGICTMMFCFAGVAGNNIGLAGSSNVMRGQVSLGGSGGPGLSSLSQLLIQQPASSIWSSSAAPVLGNIVILVIIGKRSLTVELFA